MSPRTRDFLNVISPIVLIILGVVVNAFGYLMITQPGQDTASVQTAAQTMSRIAVILVLGGLACGFLTFSSNSQDGGESDG